MMKYTLPLAALLAVLAIPAHAEGTMTPAQKADKALSQMDSDDNGSVSKAEFDSFKNTHFDEADTNDDGSLSKAELTAAKEKEMKEWKKS